MTNPLESLSGRGRVVITSSRAAEFAYEVEADAADGDRSSAFTAAMVEGLRTGAADLDGDGLISATDLYAYVRERLSRRNVPQNPQRWSFGGEGDIIIAKARRAGHPEVGPPSSSGQASVRETEPVRTTRYNSEHADVADELEFGRAADAFAELIASRELSPPLAIGLFGDWGAGKSFFMNLVKQRIKARCKDADESTDVSHVVHLRFNAWHYVDANMWASLATRIFQGIAQDLERSTGSPTDAHRVLLSQLQSSQLLLDEAERRQAAAEEALQKAQQDITNARRAQEQRSLEQLNARHPEAKGAVDSLSNDLGTDVKASMSSVRETIGNLRAASNVFSQLFTLLGAQTGAKARLRVFAVPLVLLVVGLATAVSLYAADLIEFARLTPWITILTAAFTTFSVAARKTAQVVRDGAELIEFDKLDEELAVSSAREEAGKASAELKQVQQQIDDLTALDATGIYRFVSDRYASPEYARYMGVASLIEQDLQALSRLLTASGPDRPVARGGQQMRVDRVVLYIDDLDRCPGATVLEVLQAVHLLLSLPLFVVIVGVDSKWLLGVLRSEYHTITADVTGYSETMPYSYLEKIFQIPFWVPAMDDDGYRRLVHSLVGTVHSGAPAEADGERRPVEPNGAADGERSAKSRPASTESWRITPRETEFLSELGAFVRTPRAVKRLTNVYRLLKASSSGSQRAALDGQGRYDPEFAVALTLAAVVTGFPEHTPEILQRLRTSAAPTWPAFLDELGETLDGHLLTLLRSLDLRLGGANLDAFRRWAPRVIQYSFIGGAAG
ncbi:MAG TPA: P-loop NTPase fold protein [Candidatus Limnocylindrales bacterium]|nr:P-loop NTPase fold protein [Candidatus Limnocylindrales bacterium]